MSEKTTKAPFDAKELAKWAWMVSPAFVAQQLSSINCIGCRNKLPFVGNTMHSCWRPARHLNYLADQFNQVATGHIRRLIIEAPPRHGKSFLIDWWGPVWYLNAFPHKRVMLAAYGQSLAEQWGRKVRDTIEQFQKYLWVRVSNKSSAADNWETTNGGGMTATGVGGPLLGKGANILILDDLLKDFEEANSPVMREKVWDWLNSTALTRVEPGGGVILMMQRWHEDDPVGRIKKRMAAGEIPEWKVITMRAVCEEGDDDPIGRKPGEVLWPEQWPMSELEYKKKDGQWNWLAQYQQRPTRPGGNYFKREWFEVVDPAMVPEIERTIRHWDLAATLEGEAGNDDPDFTSGAKIGVTRDGVFYILDLEHFRASPSDVERRVRHCAYQDGYETSIRIEQEPGSSGKALISRYVRDLLMGFDARGVPARGKKLERAILGTEPFSAAAERGDVKIVRGSWNESFLDELCEFPLGKHDDQVDAVVGAYNDLTRGSGAWDAETIQEMFSYSSKPKQSFGGRLGRLLRSR